MTTTLNFFKDKNQEIHITLFSGIFYNGFIIDIEESKWFLVFKDNKLGEVPIMFEDIKKVEPKIEVKND